MHMAREVRELLAQSHRIFMMTYHFDVFVTHTVGLVMVYVPAIHISKYVSYRRPYAHAC